MACNVPYGTQRTIGLREQLLKHQLTFPGNFETQLCFGSNLPLFIVLVSFVDASIVFIDIQQLSNIARTLVTFFLLLNLDICI